jgi:hypothetical protein
MVEREEKNERPVLLDGPWYRSAVRGALASHPDTRDGTATRGAVVMHVVVGAGAQHTRSVAELPKAVNRRPGNESDALRFRALVNNFTTLAGSCPPAVNTPSCIYSVFGGFLNAVHR